MDAGGNRELLKVGEVQKILGVSRSTVYEMVARHELPVLRVGKLIRVPRAELTSWIAARTTGPVADEEAA